MAKQAGSGRFLDRHGRLIVPRVGQRDGLWRDAYFSLLRMPWRGFVPLLFAAWLSIIAVFAVLFYLDPDAVAGVRPGHFGDVLFFSVETMATIGYGYFAPHSFYGHVLVTIEAFFGMLAIAVATGLTFAKFSRATARVLFSDRAVVTTRNGRPTLMIRMANGRDSQVVEAQLRLTLVRDETTAEGEWMRRFHELRLERSWTPTFGLTWTALHVIDEASPLAGQSTETRAGSNAEIVASFVGLDETFAQTVFARASYAAAEIEWGARFADMFERAPDGRRRVDYTRLHAIERSGAPE
jgi:inward rectifier potassium channel